MTRDLLADDAWALLAPFLPPERGRACRPSIGNRQPLEGIAWIARTGSSRHDPPERFGKWNTGCGAEFLSARYRAFSGLPRGLGGQWRRGRQSSDDRQHRHPNAPAQRRSHERMGRSNALGQSGIGFSTKIHVLTQAHGVPIAVHLTPGRTADISSTPTLLVAVGQHPQEELADKGCPAMSCGLRRAFKARIRSSRENSAASSRARWIGFDTPSATASSA
jgi:transposase